MTPVPESISNESTHELCTLSCSKGPLGLFKSMMGPKYNGQHLHSVVKELLGDTRVSQTLKSIVIPTFDIKLLQPIIFSTYDGRT